MEEQDSISASRGEEFGSCELDGSSGPSQAETSCCVALTGLEA